MKQKNIWPKWNKLPLLSILDNGCSSGQPYTALGGRLRVKKVRVEVRCGPTGFTETPLKLGLVYHQNFLSLAVRGVGTGTGTRR